MAFLSPLEKSMVIGISLVAMSILIAGSLVYGALKLVYFAKVWLVNQLFYREIRLRQLSLHIEEQFWLDNDQKFWPDASTVKFRWLRFAKRGYICGWIDTGGKERCYVTVEFFELGGVYNHIYRLDNVQACRNYINVHPHEAFRHTRGKRREVPTTVDMFDPAV